MDASTLREAGVVAAVDARMIPLELGEHARGVVRLVCAKSALRVPRIRAVADRLAADMARARPAS